MLYNVCGLSCGGCPHLGKECAGCHSLKGKVYWAPYTGGDICPIYHCCTVQNGWKHCGECPQVPCERWKTLKDPDESDEQFQQSVNARFRALRFAGAESDLQTIPGVGKNIAQDLIDLGYPTVESLRGQDPERALSEGLLAQGTHRRPLPALCVPGSGIFRRAGRARSRKIKMVELERLNCKKWGNKNVTGKDHSVGRHWRNRRL